MGVLSRKQLWEGRRGGQGIRDAKNMYKRHSLHCSPILSAHLFPSPHVLLYLSSSPLMTSCLLVSFLLRLDRASGGASSLQLGGSCSNSRRRGSISSSCGEGLVGEWPGTSGTKIDPSRLRDEASWRMINLERLLQRNSSKAQVAIKWYWRLLAVEQQLLWTAGCISKWTLGMS